MSLPCQGWTQGCAGGSSGSSSWIPGTNSSLCSPKMLHPSMDSPGSGTQAVAVPWQGPVRSPTHVLALHALVAPPSPCARQSIIPPAWLPSGPGALPLSAPRAGHGARSAGPGQRCRHSLNQGTLCT